MQNYDKLMETQIALLSGQKPRLLLHVCCAPCCSAVLERLYPNFDVTLFYFNPNTHPEEEYEKRFAEFPKLLSGMGVTDVPILRGEYDPEKFYSAVSGLEGEKEGGSRCLRCYDLRLRETAITAKKLNYDFYCSTLSVSPYKSAPHLNEIGVSLQEQYGVMWLYSDFKKQDGYKRSIELSKEFGLYRQCYCGCTFSLEQTK